MLYDLLGDILHSRILSRPCTCIIRSSGILPKAFGPLPSLAGEEVVASWDEDYEEYSFCLVASVPHVPKSILII